MRIDHDGEGWVVPAELLAEALWLTPAEVPAMLRDGRITTSAEEGVGSDEGRTRLSFSTGRRRLRLVLAEDGKILHRSTIDYGQVPG
jgi:hypothetical protein